LSPSGAATEAWVSWKEIYGLIVVRPADAWNDPRNVSVSFGITYTFDFPLAHILIWRFAGTVGTMNVVQ
jgi:pyruvate/oxaloacetate carboxyltransferase